MCMQFYADLIYALRHLRRLEKSFAIVRSASVELTNNYLCVCARVLSAEFKKGNVLNCHFLHNFFALLPKVELTQIIFLLPFWNALFYINFHIENVIFFNRSIADTYILWGNDFG